MFKGYICFQDDLFIYKIIFWRIVCKYKIGYENLVNWIKLF